MKAKIDKITKKKKQEEDEKKRFDTMSKKEKLKHKNKSSGNIDQNRSKRRNKTLVEEERDAHEAYQLLLSEHNKRVRKRMRQKLSAVNALMKINSGIFKMK